MVKIRKVVSWLFVLGIVVGNLFDRPQPGIFRADPVTVSILTTLAISAALSAAAAAGAYGLNMLLAGKRKVNPVDRGKLDDIRIQGNGYGEFIPRGYGVFRCAGTLIDATEIIHTTSTTPGRPGGKGAPKPPTPTEINHIYTTSVDIAVCEGLGALSPDLKITRIWENTTLIYDTTVTDQGDNQYEAEKAGNTLAGGATVVSDASASGGEAVSLPTNASVQWNDAFGTGADAFLEFYYVSTAENTVEFNWNGTVFSDTLNNSNGEYTFYRSAAFTLNSGFVNDLKIKNTHAATLKVDYLIIRISGQGTGAVNPNIVQRTENEEVNLPYSGYFPQEDPGTGETSGTLAAGGNVNFTVYTGTEDQTANSTFAGINGAGNQPAYRGTVHVVFASYQLKDPFLPNFNFEVNTGVFAIDEIFPDLCSLVDIPPSDLDVTALSGDTLDSDEGFVITTRESAQKWIDDLQILYQFNMVEVDGKWKAIKRNGSSVATITSDELRGHWGDDTPEDFEVLISDVDPALLPQVVEVGFLDPLLDYHHNVMPAARQSGDYQDPQTANLPFILDASHARQLAETLLYQRHMESRALTFRTGPKYQKLHPGECVTLALTNATHVVRLEEQKIQIMGPIEFESVRVQSSVYSQTIDGAGTGYEPPVIPYVANTQGIIVDGPLLRAEDGWDGNDPVVYIGGCQRGDGTWRGAFFYQEFPRESGSYEAVTPLSEQSKIGVTTGALTTVSDPSVWDRTNSLTIDFYTSTTLESATEQDVLANPELNLIAIINPTTNDVEYVQFATAVSGSATAPFVSRYTISTLLRGRVGTDGNVGVHTSSDHAVVVDNTLKPRRLPVTDIGRPLNFKFVSSGQSGDGLPAYTQTLRGNSLKPLAPVNLRGTRNDALDLLIEWTRRSRLAGGLRPNADVPVAEEEEFYDIEIYSGATLKRTVRVHLDEPEIPMWDLIVNTHNQTVNLSADGSVDIVGLTAGATIVLISKQVYQPNDFRFSYVCDTQASPANGMPEKVGIVPVSQDPNAFGTNVLHGYSRTVVGTKPIPISVTAVLNESAASRLAIWVRGGVVKYFQDPGDYSMSPILGSKNVKLTEPFRIAIYHQVMVGDVALLDVIAPLVRTGSPSYLYTANDQTTDFGSTQSSIKTRVYQISKVVGRGGYVEKNL